MGRHGGADTVRFHPGFFLCRSGAAEDHRSDCLAVRTVGPRPFHANHLSSTETIAYCVLALSPFWGDQKCDAVKGSTCRAYAAQRAKPVVKEYVGKAGGRWTRTLAAGPNKVRRELGLLRSALIYAVKEGVLVYAPEVTLPAPPTTRRKARTREEIRALLRAAAPHLRRFIIIAIITGRRSTAILELMWTTSLTNGYVDMCRRVIQFIGEAQEETAKKRGTVRMTKQLHRLLRRWAREGGSHVIQWRGEAIEEIDTALLAASRRAGIPVVTPHQLKHTAVSWAFARGMTKEDAEAWFDTSAKMLDGAYRDYSPLYQARPQAIMEGK